MKSKAILLLIIVGPFKQDGSACKSKQHGVGDFQFGL
jgi:hypothetical protein